VALREAGPDQLIAGGGQVGQPAPAQAYRKGGASRTKVLRFAICNFNKIGEIRFKPT
jgi:hypothetical protein